MKRTKNLLTSVTVIEGAVDETPVKMKLTYEEMPITFGNLVDAVEKAFVALEVVCYAIEYICSLQTINEYKKELRKTARAFLKWYGRITDDKNSLGGVFRYKTVTASVVRRKHSIILTIGETANMKFNVELYKKGEENN